VDDEHFYLMKARMVQNLKNQDQLALYEKAFGDLQVLLTSPSWHNDDLIKASAKLSPDQLRDFIRRFWHTSQAEMLVHGNYTHDHALKMGQAIAAECALSKNSKTKMLESKVVKLAAKAPVQHTIVSKDENHVIMWYLQHKTKNYDTMAKTLLLAKMLEGPYFQKLRVEKQLGYALNANPMFLNKVSGLVFWIQSAKTTPDGLKNEIQSFINEFQQQLAMMDEAKIATYRQAIINDMEQPPQTLSDQTSRWWAPIERKDYEFDRVQKLTKALKKIKAKDLVAFSHEMLDLKGQQGQLVLASKAEQLPKHTLIASSQSFKSHADYFSTVN
jgi:secreted Zn-dependent insulinase-like peptidase